ncbi:helix-turn-helix domain-containing protein [Anaerobutyricum hallii]|uniref:helix-turn-helix domain-containing protein n=1 Tax=Anaerobutyricum hallii TaxID=39488 RepID=UPI00269399C2
MCRLEWKEKENNTWRKNKKVQGIAGLTQKAVGERVGFSIGTQDSRIRKYEKDMMAPKEDIRIKIAEALDIDMSALNDIDIQTEEDAIRILFYLEEKYGLEITKRMFRNQCSLQKQF